MAHPLGRKGIFTYIDIYLWSTPHPLTVTTRIITFLVGNPYKPSFATVTGWGVDPTFTINKSTHSANVQPEKLWGIKFVVGKIKFKLLFHGPLAE